MENEVCRNYQSRSLYCFSKNYLSEEELTENRMVRHVVFSAWRPMGTPKVYFEDFDKQTWPTISLWFFFFFGRRSKLFEVPDMPMVGYVHYCLDLIITMTTQATSSTPVPSNNMKMTRPRGFE